MKGRKIVQKKLWKRIPPRVRYSNKKLGFEVVFPSSWIVGDSSDGEDYFYGTSVGDEAKRFAEIRLIVKSLSERVSLREFVDDKYPRDMEDFNEDFEIREKVDCRVGGTDGFKVTTIYGEYQDVDYVVVTEMRSYEMTFTSLKRDYVKYAEDIDAIVKSFKLIEAK